MDTVFFSVPEEIADDLSEQILSLAASRQASAVPGFETSVDPSLLSGLSFLESRTEDLSEKGLPIAVRLYEKADISDRKMLLAGENLSGLLPGLAEILRSADTGAGHAGYDELPPKIGAEEWSLVGMAFEGWVLLFDPEADEVQKSQTGGNTTLVSLPAPPGCPLETLSPVILTSEAMTILIRHLLLLLTGDICSPCSPNEP
ncbi:MAG: hypothetical protein GX449_02850 [Synergistaceae bacterium]|nr:hypothetical protein [Synergistaceae bacterium]